MANSLHVVFGAGQVGAPLAASLLAHGHRVRVVCRGSAAAAPGIDVVRGDAADAGVCRDAAMDASVVYHCMNPAYSTREWAKLVPAFMSNLIVAAAEAGARLVVLDNLYMLGRPTERPFDEDTPMNPCSRKGEIRARAEEQLFAAHARGDVRAVCGRASDFYGPGGTQTYLGDYFWKPVLAGRTVWFPVKQDTRHTYHYIPDVVRGLAVLGNTDDDEILGRAWMLPCQPAETTRQLVERLARALDTTIRVRRVPQPMLRVLAIGVPLLREMLEMTYQWRDSFIVDDRRFRERLGLDATPTADAVEATVAWARQHYATSAR